MKKIIAITNQKGGVGKTTTAVNLAASLGNLGKKTLLIDVDPQGNSTSGVGIDKRNIPSSIYDVLVKTAEIKNVIIKTEFKKLDVIPSSMDLAAAEIELADIENRDSILKEAIKTIYNEYDYAIIDCPPSLGLVTANALCVCNSIIVPIQSEYYALEGLSQLMSTVRRIKRLYNPDIYIEGVLLTMFDGRLKLTHQVVEELKKYFPNKIFKTTIPRGVRICEAPSFGRPVIYFDKNCKGSKAYIDLAKEVIKNK